MSIYDKALINSDLDAFKNSGELQTTSLTIGGDLDFGARLTVTSAPITITSPDFAQFLFDNSQKHPDKFKNLLLEQNTAIYESTTPGELTCELTIIVSGNQISFSATLFNPYASLVTLQDTTINFKYVPYEATF